MNRIVREKYPVAQLPEDLREMLKGEEYTRLVMEPVANEDLAGPKEGFSLERLFAQATLTYRSLEEIADHVRAMRDEWD